MKKFLSYLLVLCMLLPSLALADGGDDAQYAIVYSPGLTDRLNLRTAPSQDADTQGRYYTGTVVRVNEKGEEWSSVYIGQTAIQYGYMKNEYLVFFDSEQDLYFGHPGHGYETDIFRATLKINAPLYNTYIHPGEPVARNQSAWPYIVLGDVNDDWLHVKNGTESYFVKRQDVENRSTYGLAVVVSDRAEDRLNLRAAPQKDSRVIGKVYAGTLMSVQQVTNGFAQITMVGEGRNCGVPMSEEQNQYLTCYVDADYLRWGYRSDLLGVDSFLPVAQARWTAATYQMNNANAIAGTLSQGMRMQVLGMQGNGNYLYVDLGETAPVLIKASDVRMLKETAQDGLPVLGYGIVAHAEEVYQQYGLVPYYADCSENRSIYGCNMGDTVEVLGLGEEWAQIRYWSTEGFIPRKYLDLYLMEDIQFAFEQDEPLGLATYVCGEGESLTLRWEDGRHVTYGENAGAYTLYIPPEASVTMQGGKIGPAEMEDAFIHPDEPVFMGSGRYLSGRQFMSRRGWGYMLRPLDAEKEAWYAISTFDAEQQGLAPQKIKVEEAAFYDPDTLCVYVEDGEFLEFHNCIVEIYYGNG